MVVSLSGIKNFTMWCCLSVFQGFGGY